MLNKLTTISIYGHDITKTFGQLVGSHFNFPPFFDHLPGLDKTVAMHFSDWFAYIS
jgi:hypothetical protein